MDIFGVAIIAVSLGHLIAIFGFLMVQRREPAATLAWLMTLMFLPVAGILLFWMFGSQRARRRTHHARRVSERVQGMLAAHASLHPRALDAVTADPRTASMLALAVRTTHSAMSTDNRVDVLFNGAATYRSMIAAISEARHHIHMLFYIFQPDDTGRAMRDHLVRRARDGVQVRVLLDGVGSLRLPHEFWAPLRAAGGEIAIYGPVGQLFRLRRRDRVDFRNHRKILVIDGAIGFTGGINVGREYLGLDPNIGHWRDTHLRVEGPAALSLARTFTEDWYEATKVLLDDAAFYPDPDPTVVGDAPVLIVDSGPDQRWSALHRLYARAIMAARQRVWITSPYFVPDPVIEHAMITAALSGVDVRLLLPSRSDHLLVSLAARGYYPDLLAAGVQIHEYARGFVHAKTLVVDEWVATVGSANMDIRSFRLNFELNAFVFGTRVSRELASQFLEDLAHALPVDAEAHRAPPYVRRLILSGARLLSPLL
ncbi:MAG: cardiolipin synthase [Deltaproteobacteria bacterium]|nr:cardiolipin synthase [Deltaproteobacteria bacterium]MCB9789113.1 cardiolipin synthase [Deltaproteobacteria bacterium]